eukprot:jgi/Botrbrau1/14367/Bobra.0014s0022.1
MVPWICQPKDTTGFKKSNTCPYYPLLPLTAHLLGVPPLTKFLQTQNSFLEGESLIVLVSP